MTKKIGNDKAVLSLLTFAIFLNSLTAFAQERRVRITEPIDNSALVRVPGTHHPLASAENDLGRVNGNTSMERMVLVLKPGQEQAATRTRLINGQHDKQSPAYHTWLRPSNTDPNSGPRQQDLDQSNMWLQQQVLRSIWAGFEIRLAVKAGHGHSSNFCLRGEIREPTWKRDVRAIPFC
jgi:hypothetical protein